MSPERLRSFLAVSSSYRALLDLVPGPARTDAQCDRLRTLSVEGLRVTTDALALRRATPGRKFCWPLEPLAYAAPGVTLLKSGIGRAAGFEIASLFWLLAGRFPEEVLPLLRLASRGRVSPEVARGVDEAAVSIVEFLSHDADLIAELDWRLAAVPDHYLSLPATRRSAAARPDAASSRQPAIRVIALEACNRACAYCSQVAHPEGPRLRLDDMMRGVALLGTSDRLTISVGEPFFWSEQRGSDTLTLGELLQVLLASAPTTLVTVVTSGIDLQSDRERHAADVLASLGPADRERITLGITVSEFPRFPTRREAPGEAALCVQRETFEFAVRSGILVGWGSHLDQAETLTRFVYPVLEQALPDVPLDGMLVSPEADCYGRMMEPIGRRIHMAECADVSLPDEGQRPYRPGAACLLASQDVGIAGEGAVIPGCCHYLSPYVQIANVREAASTEDLMNRVSGFRQRLASIKARLSADGTRPFSCLDCLAAAPRLREENACAAAIGLRYFDTVQRRRADLARDATTRGPA